MADFLLRTLSDAEQQLYQRAQGVAGTLEYKDQQLQDLGIYTAYQQLHLRYAAALQAATDGQQQLELLKRTVFLNWYHLTEPSCFTGIGELDATAVFASYQVLDTYLRHQQLDQELHWMLSYYASWEYVILYYSEHRLPALTDFINAVDTSVSHFPAQGLPPQVMADRGQMGIYWQSIVAERPY